ncbi:MAG: glycogen debranching N-terminal domain-containing protein, partial [Chloroflexota bacterium]
MTVALKEDALVLVTEDDGSLPLGGTSPLGLYYHDTQFLSGFMLRVNGDRPLLLSANTEQTYVATFQLMQAAGATLGTARHVAESLSIRRTRFLADGLRERIGILNATPSTVSLVIELEFEATFRDMLAVRGYRDIDQRAEPAGVRSDGSTLLFERVGRDGVRRTMEITVQPEPGACEGSTVRFERELGPQGLVTIEITAVPTEDGVGEPPSPPGFDDALAALTA